MSTINNSFDVRFNLAGAISLVLTDTTSAPPAGLVGIFSITQPDGYTRVGNISSPDISAPGGSFSFSLSFDSSGNVQQGTYVIKYTTTAPGYLSSDFTRTFVFQYSPASLLIDERYDVFTPNLSVADNTVYSVSGYNTSSISRSWVVVSTPTGTITGTDIVQSFAFGGQYYSANYTITLTSSILYTHQTYAWLTVSQQTTKTITACIEAPPDFVQIVNDIDDLKTELDDAIDKCLAYGNLKSNFEYARVLFGHILDKFKTNQTDGIYEMLKELIRVLSNNQSNVCNPTNQVINNYQITVLQDASWGSISGNIQNQTDLWNIITNLYVRDHYVHTQSVPSTTWTVNHNMGKNPSVSIVNSSGEQVFSDVDHISVNQLVITFSFPFAGIAYMN